MGASERWLVVREGGQLWLHEGGPVGALMTRAASTPSPQPAALAMPIIDLADDELAAESRRT